MLWMAKKKVPLSPEALEYFKQQGSRGGKLGGAKAWENLTPEERSARARKAANARKKKATTKTPARKGKS